MDWLSISFLLPWQVQHSITIGNAISAAAATTPSNSNPVTIWIRDGIYTEDVALTPFVNLAAAAANSQLTNTSGVVIKGTMTFTAVNNNDNVSLTNLILGSNGGDVLTNTGTVYGAVNLTNCTILTTGSYSNANGITGTNGNCYYYLYNCTTGIGGNFSAISSASQFYFYDCNINGGLVGSAVSANGFLNCYNSTFSDSFTLTDSASVEMYNCQVFSENGASAITLGTTCYGFFYNVFMQVNNGPTYAITGTGNLYYDLLNLSSGSANKIDPGLNLASPAGPQTRCTGNFSFDGGVTTLSTDGQLWIGDSTTGLPVPANLTAGAGISISNGAGSITISGTGAVSWTDISTNTLATSNAGYICTSTLTLTLPTGPIEGNLGHHCRNRSFSFHCASIYRTGDQYWIKRFYFCRHSNIHCGRMYTQFSLSIRCNRMVGHKFYGNLDNSIKKEIYGLYKQY